MSIREFLKQEAHKKKKIDFHREHGRWPEDSEISDASTTQTEALLLLQQLSRTTRLIICLNHAANPQSLQWRFNEKNFSRSALTSLRIARNLSRTSAGNRENFASLMDLEGN